MDAIANENVGIDAPSLATLDNVQANILRASKYADGKARNWSLFFFFRILPQSEFDATIRRLVAATSNCDEECERKLWLDFAQPSFANAVAESDAGPQGLPVAPAGSDAPAQAFLNWLKVIASADKSAFLSNLTRLIATSQKAASPIDESTVQSLDIGTALEWVAKIQETQRLNLAPMMQWLQYYSERTKYFGLLEKVGQALSRLGSAGAEGSLAIMVLYEVLRQSSLAVANDSNQAKPGMVRGETVTAEDPSTDATPINIAFTCSGLAALKLDPVTLASFPDAFKQGMAARAVRLHDHGASAPENWDGELGLPSIHGYFTGGFSPTDHLPKAEKFWKALRADVAAFNDPVDERGALIRFWLRLIFRGLGLEVLHIELGQDPYEVDDHGDIVGVAERVEHFGFRDGLSQPFVDLGLGDPGAGGGSPSRNGTWTPVAPGEIFLDAPDEDNEAQLAPLSRKLTVGSTFLIFRKLEQDVVGFRTFLRRQRPDSSDEQDALAAQMVGRWYNGTPLVLSPETSRATYNEARLNDFRYAADDPQGRKCPLGAHIRRANPRDIGGRNEARRHRILRRGISYGGPLLAEGGQDDEKRGLLFIAANSRIDLQFEVIQADWLNKGELLGQAGLGRCPLTGAHDGAVADSFLEANAVAPLTRLPRFVTTRGGDYFFAPGIAPLKLLADGHHFEPESKETPFNGFSMNDAATPSLFDPRRLRQYAKAILSGRTSAAIRVALPPSFAAAPQQHMCFVGQYRDVTEVLRNDDASGQLAFSVRQYTDTARWLTRGQDLLVATDTGPARQRLRTILDRAWQALADGYRTNESTRKDVAVALTETVREALDMAIRRTAQSRRIDLVNDLASRATYAVLCKIYGTPGPAWLTELGASLPFARQHAGELPPDWLNALEGSRPDDVGMATMQVWSAIILADLVGNIQGVTALHALARQAGSETLSHMDGLLAAARARPTAAPLTLVDAFVAVQADPTVVQMYQSAFGSGWTDVYYRDAAAVLLEITGTSLAAIPLTFASAMGALFKLKIDLASLLQQAEQRKDVIERLIYETERLNPNLPVRMRRCELDTTLPSGATVTRGDWVAALIAAANKDPRVFPDPDRISFDRDIKKYLMFNEEGSERQCWGRNRVAMTVLRQCVLCAGRLKGLRRIAGPAGEPARLLGVAIGLPARFTQVGQKLRDPAELP
jgi:Dyp-type peroxidase family